MKLLAILFRVIPLHSYLLALYYYKVTYSGAYPEGLEDIVIKASMISGDELVITYGHGFMILALIFLFFEIIKSASPSKIVGIFDQMFSAITAVICIVYFLAIPGFATISFLILTICSSIDGLGGFIVSYLAARRDLTLGAGVAG